jgi:hypothetical protein
MNQRQQLAINKVAEAVALRLNSGLSDRRIPFNDAGFFGSRDTKHQRAWEDYGYKPALEFEDHFQMQRRFGIAKAGITIPVEQCWKTTPKINEGMQGEAEERGGETQWEKAIAQLFHDKKLWRQLRTSDEYQRVGHYGGLVIQVRGTRDQADWEKPLGNIRPEQIVRFIPVYEDQIKPVDWNQDRLSERYGQPNSYTFRESILTDDQEQDQRNQDINVHWTRIIIFAEGAEGVNSIYGKPANEAGFNDLVTLEKIIGATGEAMWKSAAMKTVYSNTNKDAPPPQGEELDDMDEAIQDFVEGLDQYLMTGNLDPKVLTAQVMDPEQPFNIALNSYAASIGVASKIIIGAQTGRLAADEDGRFTLANMQSRRENWCTIMVENVVEWLMSHNAIKFARFCVEWDDLLAPSDKDKLELAEKMAKVNKEQFAVTGVPVFDDDEIRMISGYEKAQEDDAEDVDVDESMDDEEELADNAEGHKPPQGVRSAAAKGLELRDKYNRGGTAVGIARARDLSNGKSVNTDTINRMVSFFARHEKNRNPDKKESDGGPTNGWIAWQLWGGDAGKSWANKIADMEDGD